MVVTTFLRLSLGLHLQKLEDNPGLLPVKEGQAYKQEDKWILVKRLDLNGLGNTLDINNQKFKKFITLVNLHKPFVQEFLNTKAQAEYLKDLANSKFGQLVPSHRVKRGLIDPLGSLIKQITGNLDYTDAIRYDKEISMLGSKQMILDKKMSLVTETLDGFLNSSQKQNENVVILDKRLKKIEEIIKIRNNVTNDYLYLTHTLHMFNTFMSTFRTIYIMLNEVETALAFTKVSVLHPSIINASELLALLKSIHQFHNLMYEVNEQNLLKFERIIEIKAYIKERKITFILEVPLTGKVIFDYYKIYTLPIYQVPINTTTVIFPESPYLLAKGSKYLPVAQPCEKIDSDKFLCTDDNVVLSQTPTCAEQLLEFQKNPTQCTPYAVEIEEVKIQRISLESWIATTNYYYRKM